MPLCSRRIRPGCSSISTAARTAPRCSPASRDLFDEDREALLAQFHRPHRARVSAAIARLVARGRPVLHVAVHSFTPVLDGVVRTADLGLLYDPARRRELDVARAWRAALREVAPQLRVRSNYPYRGVSDGLTRALRRRFGDRDYAGLELEVSQQLLGDRRRCATVRAAILASLARVTDCTRARP
ncbi:MAG TPA: N-formylglutamate amidohydrolase [Nannocystaceae bacterium]|nr:N-formylglutamate amidohydrolase [Nannocystaceae bacterium]